MRPSVMHPHAITRHPTSEGDTKLLLTCWAGQLPASGPGLNAQPALTCRASQFDLDGLRGDVDLVVTGAAADARRALLDTGNEHLRTRGTSEILLAPLATGGCVLDPNLRAAQNAVDLAESEW